MMQHVVPNELKNAKPISLQARLEVAGIPTISAIEIEHYKLKKVAEMPKANFLGLIADYCNKSADEMQAIIKKLLVMTIWLSICIVSLSFFATIISYVLSADVSFPTLGVSALLCLVCSGCVLCSRLTIRTSAQWLRVPWRMHVYDYVVPAAICGRVDTVKGFCRLSVLELMQDSVLVDPILLAFDLNTGEECYIGIWEGERVIV
jgi:hypothetical protein